MKMLTGLLPPTEGTATLFGNSVEAGSLEVRNNLGYMTQAFSLYGELSVRENLILDARLYHMPEEKTKARIEELVERFGLGPHMDALAEDLPMGLRQRLSLAVAVLHEPKLLILDEPTSGVDPVARDSFWELLVDLSRNQGVTIFVTTHFMNEGMRCDRISLMNAGKVLVCDPPQKIIDDRAPPARGRVHRPHGGRDRRSGQGEARQGGAGRRRRRGANGCRRRRRQRGRARARAEEAGRDRSQDHPDAGLQPQRDDADPARPGAALFAFVGSALLMLVFGFGITTDVEHIRYATLDRDQSPESRAYLDQFEGSQVYFTKTRPATSDEDALRRLKSDDISVLLEIPPSFGRDIRRGEAPDVLAQVDGAMTFRGETVAQYVQGVHSTMLKDPANPLYSGPPPNTATVQDRYMYNPTFESIYSIVPSVPAILLLLIPAILMTVSIVREKELGSMINFYVTPTGRMEYLLGKQIPYVAIGMINFFIMTLIALMVFDVPIKGSFLTLTFCTLLYVTVTTGIGMMTSTFVSTQVAAVFITAIIALQPTVQFSGSCSRSRPWREARGRSAPSGRRPTTCTRASAPIRRDSAPVS